MEQSKKRYRVLILSGAGLSAESGLKTFRDHDGLWENHNVMEVCSVDGFRRDPKLVANFYDKRREELKNAEPNSAHLELAKLKREFPDDIAIVTQNVDDLLERAGCDEVIHLHGTLVDLRCESCGEIFRVGYESQNSKECPKCHRDYIRHNVVMFGESAPKYQILDEINRYAEYFIVIGSSGQVLPIGLMASFHEHSIINNLYPENGVDDYFKKAIHKPATEAIKDISMEIREFLLTT